MKEVVPYKTMSGALKALDNGGRFYNIFTKSDDGTIKGAELLKAAGVHSGRDQGFLFFNLAVSQLSDSEQRTIFSRLDPDLCSQYPKHAPKRLTIEDFERSVKPTQSVVVEGYPKFLEDKTEFSMFIMIPITANNVTTFMMVPIFGRYLVCRGRPDWDWMSPDPLVASASGDKVKAGDHQGHPLKQS